MATQNKLSDLNNHLFEQLERLNDDEHMEEKGSEEIERSKAIAGISKTIIDNARLVLDAQKHIDDYGANGKDMPKILSLDNNE